jgi:hypothetical protein
MQRRLSIVFLFIGLSLSSGFLPPGRLPSRSWLHLEISLHVSMFWFSHRGLSPICNAPMLGTRNCLPTDGASGRR